jgi:hypothetical protein
MKNNISIQKLSFLAVSVAFLAVGCSSTQVSRNGNDGTTPQAVSVLSYSPKTVAIDMNKYPKEWNVRSIERYTFAVPDPTVEVSANLPTFNEDLTPGSVFVEAAGADNTQQVRRVIVHSPAAN